MREVRVGMEVRVAPTGASFGLGEIGYTTIGILSAGTFLNFVAELIIHANILDH